MKKQAAFFFGSGISYASKLPDVYKITESALQDDWHFTSCKRFFFGKNPNHCIPDSTTPIVKRFLAELLVFATDYLTELSPSSIPRRPHYEDLFSLAEQSSRTKIAHVPNLAVAEFLRAIRSKTAYLYKGFTGSSGSGDEFVDLSITTCDFLHWVVDHHLGNGISDRQGLNLISEVANSVDHLDIFTLNHDTLVEDELNDSGIQYDDGFNLCKGDLLAFEGWKKNAKVDLFKLHGSVNWYLQEFKGWARQYAISSKDPTHSKDEHGNLVTPVDWKAAFLSGTIVKEQRYGVGFWGDLFTRFRENLSKHTHLVFCGYGFGDTGINERLHQWTCDRLDGSNKIVIMTPEDPHYYFKNKPFWLSELYQKGRIVFIPNYLQHCSLSEIKPFFDQWN